MTFFEWLYEAFAYVIGGLIGWITQTFGVVWFWMWEQIASWFVLVFDAVLDELPPAWSSYVRTDVLDPLLGSMALVDYVCPIFVPMQIIATAYAVVAVVRLVRWLLSFVPFLATG
jgi:hypothetical protein